MSKDHNHHNGRTPTSCSTEAKEHGDDHHEHHHDGHNHSHDKEESGFEQTLYPYIDTSKVRCLNEHTKGAGKLVFKSWDERKDSQRYCESGVDEELIFHVPFTVAVRIKSICVIGGDSETCPSTMKLFRNRDDIDLDNCDDVKADQEFDVAYDREGTHDYMVRASKFQNVNSLTIYFPGNLGGENSTRVNYIGIKGESTTYKRAVVETVYESKPQLSDHKTRADQFIPKIL